MAPNSEVFRRQLHSLFKKAERQGKNHIKVQSGELHRMVGGYPGTNHRMPICCGVMRAEMKSTDKIIDAPPKGNGASLLIRYSLPR
jgi:hypothetical protein